MTFRTLLSLGMIGAAFLPGCGGSEDGGTNTQNQGTAGSGGEATGGAGGGSAGAGTGGDGTAGAGTSGHLDAASVAELEALGVLDYANQATPTEEVAQGDAVRVAFDPSTGPICLEGAPFAAFYEDRASTDSVMIILDGGGACWSGFCFADATADASITSGAMASAADGNHFKDWDLVFIPYCDGSVFSGDNEVTLPDGATRYHHGRQNLAAGLDLAVQHFPNATSVMLVGFSAGGYGTIPGMIATRLLYPNADLFIVDDSGPGIQNLAAPDAIDARLADWKFDQVIPASCTECDGGHGQLTALFTWFLDHDSNAKVSVLSYLGDDVIGNTFLSLTDPEYEALLLAETQKVVDAHGDRFVRYMLPGNGHVLSGAYDTLTSGGVALKAFVEGMVTGDAAWHENVTPSQ